MHAGTILGAAPFRRVPVGCGIHPSTNPGETVSAAGEDWVAETIEEHSLRVAARCGFGARRRFTASVSLVR